MTEEERIALPESEKAEGHSEWLEIFCPENTCEIKTKGNTRLKEENDNSIQFTANEDGHIQGSPQILDQVGLHQFRRPGRPNRHHSPGDGGTAKMDRRKPVPPGAQFLYAAARARSPATGHLHRLAAARHIGGGRRRGPVGP